MTEPTETAFTQLKQLIEQADSMATLEYLADVYLKSKSYAELFEIRKLQIRNEMELPLDFEQGVQQLDADQQRKMEDQLLAACQEIGQLLVAEGDLSQGWIYLQPLIDREFVQRTVESIDLRDDNIDQVIEIALYQWAAPKFGYRLLLQHQGTCNGITFFDTQANYQAPEIRTQLAETLINHIYEELLQNVSSAIQERESDAPEAALIKLINNHPWVFADCGHHMDVTHLVSAARIARYCESKVHLQQALELCSYGCQLDSQLQYESEPPFEQTYADHTIFFEGLLQTELSAAVKHFQSKIEHFRGSEHEHSARAILIELLARTNQSSAAIDACIQSEQLATETDISQLVSLARSPADYSKLMDHFESKNSLLGFAISGLYKSMKR